MSPAPHLCSTCKREPAAPRFHPFCSARCKQIDLSRWLTGSYVIEGGLADQDDDSDDPTLATSDQQAPANGRSRPGGRD